MNVIPVNNWVHVSVEQEQQEDTMVLLPDDYKRAESPYKVVRVASSCNGYDEGDLVVVPTHTIQDIEVRGETIYLVLQNHIMALVREEE